MKPTSTHRTVGIAFLVIALALAGCGTDAPGDKIEGNDAGDLRRLVLSEDGVVCYVSYEGESSDLSCLPLHETNVTAGGTNGSR